MDPITPLLSQIPAPWNFIAVFALGILAKVMHGRWNPTPAPAPTPTPAPAALAVPGLPALTPHNQAVLNLAAVQLAMGQSPTAPAAGGQSPAALQLLAALNPADPPPAAAPPK